MVKAEVPYLKRCCFCLPLRGGLLVWGYFKMGLILLAWMISMFTVFLSFIFSSKHNLQLWLIMASLTLYFLAELIFTNILILGAHAKKCRILRTYIYFSMVNVLILIGLSIAFLLVPMSELMHRRTGHDTNKDLEMVLVLISVAFLYVVLNIYVIVLVRSEVMKLEDSRMALEFVNNAANAECTLRNPE